MTDNIRKELMKIFYDNAEEAGKNHYKIPFPEQLVTSIFAASLQLLSDMCVVAIPEEADTSKFEGLFQDNGYEIKLSPLEEK